MTRCFRFQCGSIITEYEGFTSKQARYFRFQCGSIITVCVCYLPNPVITLDSNVVLLLLSWPLVVRREKQALDSNVVLLLPTRKWK